MAPILLGHNEKTGGVPVQAMNEPGTYGTSDRGESIRMVKEGVHEGPRWVTRRGVDHHSGWFVYDEEVIVFVHDVEGNRFGTRFWATERRDSNLDPVLVGEDLGFSRNLPVEQDPAVFDQARSPCPRNVEGARQPCIDSGALAVRLHHQDRRSRLAHPARLKATRTETPSISSSSTAS